MLALILAAGRGARMGAPKALLVLDGEPLIARHVRSLRALGCARVVVAAPGALVERVRALAGEAEVVGVDTASQAETLAALLRHVGAIDPTERVLVTPVDLRPPRLDTLRALVEAGGDAVHPRHRDRNGHPLIVRAALLAPYRQPGDPPPLDLAVAAARRAVEVDDPAVIDDFDRPADLRSR